MVSRRSREFAQRCNGCAVHVPPSRSGARVMLFLPALCGGDPAGRPATRLAFSCVCLEHRHMHDYPRVLGCTVAASCVCQHTRASARRCASPLLTPQGRPPSSYRYVHLRGVTSCRPAPGPGRGAVARAATAAAAGVSGVQARGLGGCVPRPRHPCGGALHVCTCGTCCCAEAPVTSRCAGRSRAPASPARAAEGHMQLHSIARVTPT